MEIISIKNKNTGNDVCSQYLHKKLNPYKSKIIVGEKLVVVYESGTSFNHEIVVSVKRFEDYIQVETTNKLWVIKN